ncbi:MAG: trypsin-like serine protease [Synechococcaceae cyanobacterium SM2_3_1]|nr:trypsin-like serine protease [Synechococcaceae cyanobacterium SM2_3_1]
MASSSVFTALLTLSLLVGCSTQLPTLESTLDPDDQGVSAVVNGKDASPTDYRFMVALYIRTEDPQTTLFCGGTLLDGNSVLTAAHCVAPPRLCCTPEHYRCRSASGYL